MPVAARRRDEQDDRWALPGLQPRPGGLAERFAGRVGGRHPAAMFFAALLAGFALLAVLSILLGLLITGVVLHTSLAGTDESAIRSLVAERTPFLTDASSVGSTVGSSV